MKTKTERLKLIRLLAGGGWLLKIDERRCYLISRTEGDPRRAWAVASARLTKHDGWMPVRYLKGDFTRLKDVVEHFELSLKEEQCG